MAWRNTSPASLNVVPSTGPSGKDGIDEKAATKTILVDERDSASRPCPRIRRLVSRVVARGFAQSEALGCGRDGFYFFPPEETASWRAWNYGCVRFYYPLIVLDVWLGTGRDVYCEPLWRLSG